MGVAYANIEQDLELLIAQKDIIAEEVAQVLVLETKMNQAPKAIEKLEKEISRDPFLVTFYPSSYL